MLSLRNAKHATFKKLWRYVKPVTMHNIAVTEEAKELFEKVHARIGHEAKRRYGLKRASRAATLVYIMELAGLITREEAEAAVARLRKADA